MPAPMGEKFYGLYRGIVLDNKDPKNQGRLKVAVPGVYGNDMESGEPLESTWALPKFIMAGMKWGVEMIPPVKNPDGSPVMVWVEFEMGDQKKPVWSGCFIKPDHLYEPMQKVYPDKTIPFGAYCIATPRGNYIYINDNDDGGVLEIADRFGNKITMNADGISVTSPIAYKETAPTIDMN